MKKIDFFHCIYIIFTNIPEMPELISETLEHENWSSSDPSIEMLDDGFSIMYDVWVNDNRHVVDISFIPHEIHIECFISILSHSHDDIFDDYSCGNIIFEYPHEITAGNFFEKCLNSNQTKIIGGNFGLWYKDEYQDDDEQETIFESIEWLNYLRDVLNLKNYIKYENFSEIVV